MAVLLAWGYFGNRCFKRIILLIIGSTACSFMIASFQTSDISKLTEKTVKFIQSSIQYFQNWMNLKEDVELEETLELICNYLTFKDMYGRLGNRMFSYASLYGLARTNRKIPFLTTNQFSLTEYFNLSIKYENISLDTFVVEKEQGCCNFYENITRLDCDSNVTLDGFLQSYKYFDKYKGAIKREFTFQDHVASTCDKELRRALNTLTNASYSTKSCYVVGAHMRRGDFVFSAYQHKGYVPAESKYLHTAITYFERRFQKLYKGCVLFLVTGNDHNWNTRNAPIRKWNVLVLPNLSAEVDLCILSRCNGTIMSTGSFGWWAAYLAGGPTTYMKNQCRPNSSLCSEFRMQDYIDATWDWHSMFPFYAQNVSSIDSTIVCNYLTFSHQGGRLGNHMFRYSSLYALAKINRKIPFLSTSTEVRLDDYFSNLSITYENYSFDTFVAEKEEQGCCKFDENNTRLNCNLSIVLNGFLQSYKYFDKYKTTLKREFTFRENISSQCDKELRKALKILSNNTFYNETCYIVGAHMRRGDFVTATYRGYVPADSDYLLRAIAYFEFRLNNKCVLFLITGDDYKWNVENAPKHKWNVLVLPKLSAAVDMCILSRCNGTIMSTGTFSWWAAYLAGGPTTYMKDQCRPNSSLCSQFRMQDYIDPTWDWHPM